MIRVRMRPSILNAQLIGTLVAKIKYKYKLWQRAEKTINTDSCPE